MNSQEARQVLEVYRPERAGEADPRVAEALRCLERDPALARWYAAHRDFNDTMSAVVQDIVVPADLKDSILAARKVVKPPFWQRPLAQLPRDWRARAAVAAAVVLLAASGGLLLARQPSNFSEFRRDLIALDWAGEPHLDFESSDMNRVRAYLAEHQGGTDFTLPPGLTATRVHGCRVFERDGERVALICLAEGPRHLHLFVLDRPGFSDLPRSGAPDFEKCGGWKTTSWRQGETIYVLTGMNYQTFVSRFRKGGRWTMSG